MATFSFPVPSNVASFLSDNFSGLVSTSEDGGSTISLQVPAFGSSAGALPAPVVSGLQDAGFQVPAAAAAGSGAAGSGAAGAGSGSGSASVGLAQFAPAGLVPQDQALEDPNLEGAVSFAQNIAQQANEYFQQAAAEGPIDPGDIATFASQQNQAISDYIFGGGA